MTACGFSLRPNNLAPNALSASSPVSDGGEDPSPALLIGGDPTDPHEILRLRIRKLIRDNGACFAAVSEMLGRSHSYIQQYVTRRSPKCLREHDRRRIARHFNIPEWDLLLPEEQLSAAAGSDLVLIPPWRPTATGGTPPDMGPDMGPDMSLDMDMDMGPDTGSGRAGGAASNGSAVAHPFRREWLQARFGAAITALAMAVIADDGMAPTLCDGDLVLVQRGHGFHSDGLYLIEVAGRARARRMTAHPARDRIVISHDNPLYPAALECRPDELSVIGRVIWLSRAL